MKFTVKIMAYLGYEKKEHLEVIKASNLEKAKAKAVKEVHKLNEKHRGYYEIVSVNEA